MLDYSHDDWKSRADTLSLRHQAFIDGKFADAASGETFDCINPATGDVLAQVAACGAEDVDRAVIAARKSFDAGSWSRAAPGDRKAVLLKLADLIRQNLEEMALLDSLDMGKLITDAITVDAPGSAHFFQWYAESIDKIYDEVAPTGPGDLALIKRVPLGVVGAVTPWNFPLDMATWKSAAALAAGNSVVLKPAEQSPLSALRLAELAAEAGLPDGVLNVVPGFGVTAGESVGLAYGCGYAGLYRLNRSGQNFHAVFGPIEPQIRLAGNWWQKSQPDLCRLRKSGRGGGYGGIRHLLQSGGGLLGQFAALCRAIHQGRIRRAYGHAGEGHATG